MLPALLVAVTALTGCGRYRFTVERALGADGGTPQDGSTLADGGLDDGGAAVIPGVVSLSPQESNYIHILTDSGCPAEAGASPVCGGPTACNLGDVVVAIPTGTGASVWLASIGMDCSAIDDAFLPEGPTYRPGQVGERGLRAETRFTAACPAGTLMIGADFRTTYAFITVRLRCLPPSEIVRATEISAAVQLSEIAGFDSGTDVWQRAECPPGHVVTGFTRWGTTLQGTNQYVAVDGVSLECRELGAP